MTRPRRVPLSLNLLPEARTELYQRAERDGHRYPAVLGATLLERALLPPHGGGGVPLSPALAQELIDMIEALTERLTDEGAPPPEPHTIVAELDRMYLRLKREVSDGEDV